jgi:hypothetical protein
MSSPPHVASDRWTDEFLDSMRLVTDPEPDALVADIYRESGKDGLLQLKAFLDNWQAPVTPGLPQSIREFFERPVEYPSWVDPKKIAIAEDLFVSYGPVTTVVLVLNAVPHFFTNPAGARSFYLAKIFSPDSVRNRMHEVPQFVINITQRGGLAQTETPGEPPTFKKGGGIMTVQKLRMAHARIRLLIKLHQERMQDDWDLKELGEPINQEDLAEALMYFCLWTQEGLRKVGIDQTPEEQEAMLHSWKTVGYLLGLRDELQPQDIAEAKVLRDAIARRHTRATPEGAALIKEMLDIVRGMLPRIYWQLPSGLMRYQLGDEVADMLEVPNPRLLMFVLMMMRPFSEKKKIFARLARIISPPLVKWLVTHPRTGERGPFNLPDLWFKHAELRILPKLQQDEESHV